MGLNRLVDIAGENIANDVHNVLAEETVVFRVNQLQQKVHLWLVSLQRSSKHVLYLGTLTRTQLLFDDLLDGLVFFILNEGFKWPSHLRLVFDGDL